MVRRGQTELLFSCNQGASGGGWPPCRGGRAGAGCSGGGSGWPASQKSVRGGLQHSVDKPSCLYGGGCRGGSGIPHSQRQGIERRHFARRDGCGSGYCGAGERGNTGGGPEQLGGELLVSTQETRDCRCHPSKGGLHGADSCQCVRKPYLGAGDEQAAGRDAYHQSTSQRS